jgi:hypothetical protein
MKRLRLLVLPLVLLLAGCSVTSVGVGMGGGGFGVGASVSQPPRYVVPPKVYRRMELAGEECCPPDTILIPPYRSARGLACFFDTTLVSDDGSMRACDFEMPEEEGGRTTVLCVDDEPAVATYFMTPIAWEPGGSRLLVREAAADDDLKMFVLDVGDGQYTKTPEERMATRIGNRGDVYRGWDGNDILLENFFDPGVVRRVPIPDER